MMPQTLKESNPIHIEFLNENRPAVLSTEIAERFQKKHQHILRDIDRIHSQVPKIFFETNFGQSFREATTGNGTVRKFPVYLLTRDAFTLLVMGFTGAAAIRWKLRYIEAFNSLEAAVLENRAASLVEPARESGYRQGLDEGRASAAPLLRQARSEAAQLALTFTPARKSLLRKALRYAGMGLSNREIARLLGAGHTTINALMRQGRLLGFVAEENRPRQAYLPGVTA